jgi:DNA repair protein RadC
MPSPNPTRPYTIPGFRIALVREPGVTLSSKPEVRTPAAAAPMLAQYIGETDREMFVIAMLTVRHRVLGLHTVSVGCLTSSLVHPRLCCARHKVHYVAAAVMLRPRPKTSPVRDTPLRDAT